jgi:hypothetical protein
MFDFNSAEIFHFKGDNSSYAFELASLPSNLSAMALEYVFLPKTPPIPGPHSMPHITTLEFCFMDLPSHLQHYFHFPKLKRLALASITCRSSLDPHERQNYGTRFNVFLDPLFFQSVPDLEFLSLRGTPVDNQLLDNIQSCPQLRKITMDRCKLENEALITLAAMLANEGHLPSLKIVHVDNSWPPATNLPFDKFIKLCIRHRPGMVISGNEKEYNFWGY